MCSPNALAEARKGAAGGSAPSLVQCCVQKLVQTLLRSGNRKIRYSRLSELPSRALDAFLELLTAKNGLTDSILPHVLNRETYRLQMPGPSQLRRSVVSRVGRACECLQVLDVRNCPQVDNRIVRDVLQYCEYLAVLRLDGCTRISDSAFAPVAWSPPLAGLLSLQEISLGKCGQVTKEGLMGYVIKGAPSLRSLSVSFCRLAITEDVAAELLWSLGLDSLDLSHCDKFTDAPFKAGQPGRTEPSPLRDLRIANTQVTDRAAEQLALCAPELEVLDASEVVRLTDKAIVALAGGCTRLRRLSVNNTSVTDAAFEALRQLHFLEHVDASWCTRVTAQALEILATSADRPPLKEFVFDHIDAARNLGLRNWSSLGGGGGSTSPILVRDLSPLLRPVADDALDAVTSPGLFSLMVVEPVSSSPLPPPAGVGDFLLPEPALEEEIYEEPAVPALLRLAQAYGTSIARLSLEGVRDVVDANALKAIAESCPHLAELSLAFAAGRDADDALEVSLSALGTSCPLRQLQLDCSLRSHAPVVESLALPRFCFLVSLNLWCCSRSGGLQDAQLESILSGRTSLLQLEMRNCEGVSESLFPRWCGHKEADTFRAEVLDAALDAELQILATMGLGDPFEASATSPWSQASASSPIKQEPPIKPVMPSPELPQRRPHGRGGQQREPGSNRGGTTIRRRSTRNPAALALRTVRGLTLGGAPSLTDRSMDALAELSHDLQTVVVRGCPQLTSDSLKSFQKGCRVLRSVSITTQGKLYSWPKEGTILKGRRRRTEISGSSGTESG